MKNKKNAISLAELIIVVVIVGIVALIFITMPKKNVGKMDKAKYYVAYDMLKRLQDEQMANDGNVEISSAANFKTQVEKWLNTIPVEDDNATLSNGMLLSWRNGVVPCPIIDNRDCLIVNVDIDGRNNGSSRNEEDIHEFYLTDTGQVIPHQKNNTASGDPNEWITFKVYYFNEDGRETFIMTNVSFENAFLCREKNVGDGCENCFDNDTHYCFIEAVPPLK